jgi:aspartyl aminopeptidase
MIASYRLDNLASVHAALSAFGHLEAPAQDTLQMLCLWDHEEIGSVTKEGATSPFVSDLFERIGYAFQMDTEEKILLKNHSLCVSVDMAHAFNPNYAKKYEPQHQPLLGEGIVIKYNANQKYASNALSAAVIIRACQHLNLPYQSYVNRSDIPSGTTVGPLFAQAMGINTVDIGCPELSMHSIREVMACKDYLHLVQLLTYLLEESTT